MASLATGETLTKQTWFDFVKRLNHDVRGEGVKQHCTSDAIFIVQSLEYTYGLSDHYSDNVAIISNDGDSCFHGVDSFWKSLDANDKRMLNKISKDAYGKKFTVLDQWQQTLLIEDFDNYRVTYCEQDWVYVCAHFTKEAANAFIRRKAHDYKKLRVYACSQYYCWEYKEIINAILSGKLVFTGE